MLGASIVARIDSAWIFRKGSEDCTFAERIRISPAPKLGGWAGRQLRFLSVSRGQSILTDIQHGSFAVKRRVTGLPSMQRMWFGCHGHSLGYTKPRDSAAPAELFFYDAEARLWAQQRLPVSIADVCGGAEQWFVACRDGRVYAFSLEGNALWNQLIPHARRDQATNAFWGLPIFHPRLHLAAEGPFLAIAAEQEFHRYDPSGAKLWSQHFPAIKRLDSRIEITDLPTREARLSRLGLAQTANPDRVRTAYFRMALETPLNAGWLKQVQLYELQDEDPAGTSPQTSAAVQFGGYGFRGVNVLRAAWNMIAVGTHSGLVHIFDWHGSLKRTFQVGDTAVSALLVTGAGLRAAYCAGRVTLFDGGQISGSTEMPEYFAELGDCGTAVLAWQSKTVWLLEPSGRVQVVAETDRPIRGVWGYDSGFYVLAGELACFRVRPT